MDKIFQLANLYVASLRALYLLHTNFHWLTKGTGFYGDHLLFERLYKQAQEDADLAAEKCIGLLGENAVDLATQAEHLSKLLAKYQGDNYHELALQTTNDFLAFSEQVYEVFEAEGVLTLGCDDMIMAIASNQETAVYLLQQALNEK